jgi:hypothetical protein
VKKNRNHYYVVRTENHWVDGERRQFTVYLHHVALPIPRGYVVDHINGNGLDNRPQNLRVVTNAENAGNRRYFAGSSRFRGVSYAQGRIRAQIQQDGKQFYLGVFATEEEAARAYDREADRLFGSRAIKNFSDAGDSV